MAEDRQKVRHEEHHVEIDSPQAAVVESAGKSGLQNRRPRFPGKVPDSPEVLEDADRLTAAAAAVAAAL